MTNDIILLWYIVLPVRTMYRTVLPLLRQHEPNHKFTNKTATTTTITHPFIIITLLCVTLSLWVIIIHLYFHHICINHCLYCILFEYLSQSLQNKTFLPLSSTRPILVTLVEAIFLITEFALIPNLFFFLGSAPVYLIRFRI